MSRMCHKVNDLGLIEDDDGDDTGQMSEGEDADDEDPPDEAAEKKIAVRKLGPFMVTLVLALAAGEGVKGGFECDPSGVSHFNMPEKALDCIAPINPDDLRAHAADYGREMDKDSGSIWDFRMVGSSDPRGPAGGVGLMSL
jgi:hypothetical protein